MTFGGKVENCKGPAPPRVNAVQAQQMCRCQEAGEHTVNDDSKPNDRTPDSGRRALGL